MTEVGAQWDTRLAALGEAVRAAVEVRPMIAMSAAGPRRD